MSGQEKRIWYQGFTDPAEHHEYFGRLQALVSEVAEALGEEGKAVVFQA